MDYNRKTISLTQAEAQLLDEIMDNTAMEPGEEELFRRIGSELYKVLNEFWNED